VSPAIRLALLRKYRLLLAWRLGRDTTSASIVGALPVEDTRQAEMRSLAAEFPGCLRELDQLGPTELSRRVDVLASGEGGREESEKERWLNWIWAYHQLMRVALAIRRDTQDKRQDAPLGGERLTHLIRDIVSDDVDARTEALMDAAFVRGVEKPPAGRLSVLVVQTIAKAYAVSADEIAAALFRPRRPHPYDFSTR